MMARSARLVTLLSLLSAAACSSGRAEPARELDPALQAYVLPAVPRDVQHRTFIDFEGKVHLSGYDLSPAGTIAPGSSGTLTLYWSSIAPLGPGWSTFTHVLDPSGEQLANLDSSGPLRQTTEGRQALPPSEWQPGKVYKDEVPFEMPRNIRSPEAVVVAGIWRPPLGGGTRNAPLSGLRLDVVSGSQAGENRAIVAYVPTGVPRSVRPLPRPSSR
ncbi:MAG TPA: hypothetical protein VKZ49_11010 [Polyangiaceae bacterium]|nr:hypothetical protein [Polyangiaceae bacterium]